MDGKKDRAAILPIFQTPGSSTDNYKGQEYLGIYPYTVEATVQNSTENKMWVCEASDIYVSFDKCLTGTKPYKR